jgi:eukaryotic-like serine/threonine-protein kinase
MSEPRILKKRYRLGGKLGPGGMSVVWSAEDLENPGTTVAIKRIKTVDDAIKERAWREVRTVQTLNHPDIPAIHDHWVDEGGGDIMYLVMDLVPGPSLREIMFRYVEHGEPIPLNWTITLAAHVFSTLTYVHDQSVIHRDIIPNNLLIFNGRVNLVDFDIRLDSEDKKVGSPALCRPSEPIRTSHRSGEMGLTGHQAMCGP